MKNNVTFSIVTVLDFAMKTITILYLAVIAGILLLSIKVREDFQKKEKQMSGIFHPLKGI